MMGARRAIVGTRVDRDDGSVTLLSLGFGILAILVILVGAAATGLHLDRSRLTQAADQMALDAADALDVATYYAGGAPVPTDDAAIAMSASQARQVVVASAPAVAERYGLDAITVVSVTTADGRSVTVTISTTSGPLFGLAAWMPWGDVTLTASASARVHES